MKKFCEKEKRKKYKTAQQRKKNINKESIECVSCHIGSNHIEIKHTLCICICMYLIKWNVLKSEYNSNNMRVLQFCNLNIPSIKSKTFVIKS